jgi:hypothetical protein
LITLLQKKHEKQLKPPAFYTHTLVHSFLSQDYTQTQVLAFLAAEAVVARERVLSAANLEAAFSRPSCLNEKAAKKGGLLKDPTRSSHLHLPPPHCGPSAENPHEKNKKIHKTHTHRVNPTAPK